MNNGRMTGLAAMALLLVACSGSTSPVVVNRSDQAYFARVGGVADDAATARVIVVPPGSRVSLEDLAGLPTLFLTDVTVLDGTCAEVATWTVDDEQFLGAVVIDESGHATHDADDRADGTEATASSHCPPGPDILP
jgi:hypothetical protein